MAFNPHELGGKLSSGFNPNEFGKLSIENPAAEQLESIAQKQNIPMNNQRTPQIQEEFSNPSVMKEFNEFPQKEQLKRIALSQFDPANMTSTGSFVPPGTYESDPARMIGSALLALSNPEISAGRGLFSRYVGNPLLNMASRIGSGTIGNIGYQSPNIKNEKELIEAAQKGFGANALLEAGALPFRSTSHLGEIFNPEKFAQQKSNQIKKEFESTKSQMNNLYKPVQEEYNHFPVTVTPEKYLKSAGVTRNKLYPDAKIIYDEFKNEPNFNNLHRLQSKIGEDWARTSQHPTTYERSQAFNNMRERLKEKTQNFLKRDENALNQYKTATEFAKSNYFPYLSTPTLRKISKGKLDVSPRMLSSSIKKGTEKTVGREEKNVIPESHALRNHLQDLNKMINFGKAAQTLVPTATGALVGESISPGLGGMLGGALGGAAGAGLSKFASPAIASTSQNPLIQHIFKNILSPAYYSGGRATGNVFSNNE